ncbi:hypothetical protein ANCCAN_29452, partial [Ancylostoma caninum]
RAPWQQNIAARRTSTRKRIWLNLSGLGQNLVPKPALQAQTAGQGAGDEQGRAGEQRVTGQSRGQRWGDHDVRHQAGKDRKRGEAVGVPVASRRQRHLLSSGHQ